LGCNQDFILLKKGMAKSRLDIQQKMFGVIEQWNQSELPIKEFCSQHQIVNSTFHYWLKKYREKDQKSLDPFIPIRVKETSSNAAFAELTLPDGRRFTFYQSLECSFIKSLLS
jgi:hypothetical protein